MVLSDRNRCEVVIVGGGVIGLSIAHSLASRGVKDIIIVERAGPGSESSSAAAGMLAPQAEADSADEFFQLSIASRDLYSSFAHSLREESGVDIELDKTGTLYLALTEEDEEECAARFEWQKKAGLSIERFSATDARALEPCVSESVRAALRFPLDVQVENRRLITALSEANDKYGVRTMVGTTVERINHQRGSVLGVETSAGPISCANVVLAAGAWMSAFSNADKSLPAVRVEPVRGQMLCFETNPRLARHVIYSPRGYIVPRMDGRLLAGSTTENAGFDKRVTAEGLHKILTHALEISPERARLPMIDSWAGLRPRAVDDLPVLGPCAEIEGLFYATGHYRNGILLAPITGELIAEAIVNKTVSPLITPFTPERFTFANA
jgi:glycine oxidase